MRLFNKVILRTTESDQINQYIATFLRIAAKENEHQTAGCARLPGISGGTKDKLSAGIFRRDSLQPAYRLRADDVEQLNRDAEKMVLDLVEHRIEFDDVVAWIEERIVPVAAPSFD